MSRFPNGVDSVYQLILMQYCIDIIIEFTFSASSMAYGTNRTKH